MRKIIASTLAALYTVMLAITPALAVNVTASVTVTTICSVDVSAGSITFDGTGPESSVNPGSNSFEDGNDETITLTNSGNADTASLTIEGSDWGGINPSNSMGVGQTKYDTDGSMSPFANVTLSSSPAPIYEGVITDNDAKSTIFDVEIPNDQPADTYTQTITFTFGCD